MATPSQAGAGVQVPVREMIGRTASPLSVAVQNVYATTTTDWTKADPEWWDKLRRGKQKGYELGALFARPISGILADWTLGKGLLLRTGHEATDQALTQFADDHLTTLLDAEEEAVGLGNEYLAVETDGSLTRLSPNLVTPILNPANARDVWGYTVHTKPSENVEITDTYRIKPTPERRLIIKSTVSLTDGTTAQHVDSDETYPLLIDELPIIPINESASSNEVYGHPYYEALRKLFAEYDDTLSKSLSGVKVMGNPLPVLEEVEDPAAEIDTLSGGRTVTTVLEDGTQVAIPVIDFAALRMLITRGKFKFAGPDGFTQDAGRLLEFLFLLMLQHSRIPEWVWGGAVASSMASVQAQWPAWERFIQGRQRRLVTPLRAAARVHLKYRALVERGLRPDLKIGVDFPNLASRSEENLRGWTELADKAGAIRKETIVRVADLPGVQDPTAEVAAAAQEGMDRQAVAEAAMQAEIERLAIERNQENAA